MKKTLTALGLLLLTLGLVACGGKTEKAAPEEKDAAATSENSIVLGVSPVPHEEILEALKPELEEAGLDVKLVAFDDYVQPNVALSQGDLDANFFQHKPYLDDFIAERHLDLVSIGAVHIEPMGLYSKTYKSIDDFKDGDEILIPNDPSNGARALLLLEKHGLIKLNDPTNPKVTERDITENPKNLKITALDAANIANVYGDVAGAVINSNFAIGAGLNPSTDALIIEEKDSPYANIVAVRKGEENQEKFKKLMEVLNSEACKKFIDEKYKGSIHAAF